MITAKILSLAWLVVLDGLRRYAIIGLVVLTLLIETGGLLFVEFIPRDIGRVAGDFILSVGFFSGILFLLFHAVQTIAWDEERKTIHTFLARPISRSNYVLGVFCGQAVLLLILNLVLSLIGFGVLYLLQVNTSHEYFPILYLPFYLLSWAGLFCIELLILAAIMLFSGLVRGGFPVLLLTVSYYLICTGLPVVRDAYIGRELDPQSILAAVLKWSTALFPDLSRFDFKGLITQELTDGLFWQRIGIDFILLACYLVLCVTAAALVYQRRDLQ